MLLLGSEVFGLGRTRNLALPAMSLVQEETIQEL